MPKKAVLSDVADIVQIRKAFEDFIEFSEQGDFGYNRDEIISLVINWCDRMSSHEE